MRAAIASAWLWFSLALWSATLARAETHDHELWLGGDMRALRSSSANALTDYNLSGGSVGYAHDLGLGLARGVAVWAQAGVTGGSADGTMFQTLSTQIDATALTGGLRVRAHLHRLIAASARIELGAQRVRVDISDRGGATASDHGWGTMASAGAALDLFAMTRAPLGLGVRVEVGYVLAQAISLTPHRDAGGDVLMLPATAIALGSLDLSGPRFALSLVGQF